MTTLAKTILSASTDGRAIKVAATATPGTTIHTGSATSTTLHEVWLYAQNTDTASHVLTVEWGGTTSPDDKIILTVAAQSGPVLVAAGFFIKGNATPLVVKAFADAANVLTILGHVTTIT